MEDLLSEIEAARSGLGQRALVEALRAFESPPEDPVDNLLRTEEIRRRIAVYRVAIGNYTDRKLALRRRCLQNSNGLFRVRRNSLPIMHWGVGDNTYSNMITQYYSSEDLKNRIRKELMDAGIPMRVLRQVHRGEL